MTFFQFATKKKKKKRGSLNSEVDNTGSQLLILLVVVPCRNDYSALLAGLWLAPFTQLYFYYHPGFDQLAFLPNVLSFFWHRGR